MNRNTQHRQLCEPLIRSFRVNGTYSQNVPMRRHLAQPLHTGVFHRHRRVEAFGDDVGDDGLTLFLEQFDQALLLFD